MRNTQRWFKLGIAAVAMVSMFGCANLSHRQQNTAVGAGVGAVAGSVLTGGSTIGTLGGAAIGGVIGHGTSEDSRRRR